MGEKQAVACALQADSDNVYGFAMFAGIQGSQRFFEVLPSSQINAVAPRRNHFQSKKTGIASPTPVNDRRKQGAVKSLMSTWVQSILPHKGMCCFHGAGNSGEVFVGEFVSDRLPSDLLASISANRQYLESSVYSHVLWEGNEKLYSLREIEEGAPWFREFFLSGYRNVLCYAYKTGEESERITLIALFDVEMESYVDSLKPKELVMPVLHAALSKIYTNIGTPTLSISMTPAESQIAKFLRLGLANKEIAKQSGRSQRMVVHHVGNLMQKFKVKSRAALAIELSKIEHV